MEIHDSIRQQRTGVNDQIDKGDPRLVIQVKLPEGEGPGVLYQNPADEVCHHRQRSPKKGGENRLPPGGRPAPPKIDPGGQGEDQKVIERVPGLGPLVALPHAGAFLHGAHMQHNDVKTGVYDPHHRDNEIGRPVAGDGKPQSHPGAPSLGMGLPSFFSCRHLGGGPSSPQYSSRAAIFPSHSRRKEVTWKERPCSRLKTRAAVMMREPVFSTRSSSPSHSPGYSQLARINSSTVKRSPVLCQFTQASG